MCRYCFCNCLDVVMDCQLPSWHLSVLSMCARMPLIVSASLASTFISTKDTVVIVALTNDLSWMFVNYYFFFSLVLSSISSPSSSFLLSHNLPLLHRIYFKKKKFIRDVCAAASRPHATSRSVRHGCGHQIATSVFPKRL